MAERDVVSRVAELADQIGYPRPTVSWVEGAAGRPSVQLYDDGRTLAVHDRVEDLHSRHELDLLIAQELIQAKHGGPRHRRRIKLVEAAVASTLGAAAVLVLRPTVDPLWQAFLLAMAGTYVVWTALHVLLGAIWSRWFTRRTDRELVEVVGREQVVQWLKRHVHVHQPARLRGWFRWVSDGVPPDPAERLRMLEKS